LKRGLALALLIVVVTFAMSNGAPTLSCTQCHVDAKPIPPQDIVIKGLPKEYKPGQIYNITIKILDVNKCNPAVMAGCGGFAVHVSAGKLIVTDPKDTMLAQNPIDGVYITHTEAGHMKREWHFAWKAPNKPVPVTFKVAVIAANGDATPFGDYYGAKVITVYPQGWKGPIKTQTQAYYAGGASSQQLQTIKNLLIFSLILNSITVGLMFAMLALMLIRKK
jgi:hypothetical protein